MTIQTISLIISDTLRAATSLILAALGELVTEKSRVCYSILNFGFWIEEKI